jgi:predicted DNA-binding protein with PD1-like motif
MSAPHQPAPAQDPAGETGLDPILPRAAQARRIAQPGPAPAERIQWAEATGRPVAFALPAGVRLLDAVRQAFVAEGFHGGVLRLEGGALAPFAYVMPALSRDGRNAAFYSDTFRPSGTSRLRTGALTFGIRDDAPFFHCHALWTEADGALHGGHILPDETVVAEPIRAAGFGLAGAAFLAEPDPETNFTLFGPVPQPGAAKGGRAFALRLRPNQDLAGALEAFCRARGIARARLHGGVGSIIGARFRDGSRIEPFATEMAVTAGHVAPDAGGTIEAVIDAALVDYTGGIAAGRLVRGDNPILMTLEIVLEPE